MKVSFQHADKTISFTAHKGQWRRDVWNSKAQKSETYYFGSVADDPEGTKAMHDPVMGWLARHEAIKLGLDKLRLGQQAATDLSVGELAAKFLEAKKSERVAGDISLPQYRDYMREVEWAVSKLGSGARVSALRPQDFAVLARLLITGDGKRKPQGPHARRRIIANIKAMFRWGDGNGHHPAVNFGTEFVGPDTSKEAVRKHKARAGIRDNSKRIVTGPELDKLLDRANPQFKAIILLSVNTGMGPADLGRLRWWQLNLETGHCPTLPRGKTGNDRAGYLWKKTRAALRRVRTLKHNAAAIAKDGDNALVFVSRKNLPMYREAIVAAKDGAEKVKIDNAISGTLSKMAKETNLVGVTQYRFRHTFKTLGKRAKDPDTLDFMMGHTDRSVKKTYDQEEIDPRRVKRVARIIYRRLWMRPKTVEEQNGQNPTLRLTGSVGVAVLPERMTGAA